VTFYGSVDAVLAAVDDSPSGSRLIIVDDDDNVAKVTQSGPFDAWLRYDGLRHQPAELKLNHAAFTPNVPQQAEVVVDEVVLEMGIESRA
jgi:hypothetical protein